MITEQRITENRIYLRAQDGREFSKTKEEIASMIEKTSRTETESALLDELGVFLGEGQDKREYTIKIAEDGTPLELSRDTCIPELDANLQETGNVIKWNDSNIKTVTDRHIELQENLKTSRE